MEINQAFTILANAGGVRAARIITENNKKLSRFSVWRIARKLRRGVPVAKIINQKWFYGLSFYTNKHTLDPRPDTETLVSAVIADCGPDCTPRILDLGTGTGCIVASLVKNIHGATGVGVDKSYGAVRVARRNIRRLGLEKSVRILCRSFNRRNMTRDTFDIIVSNPPYIARGDRRVDSGAMHDPSSALYADNDGYAAYEIIARNAVAWIKPGGKIYLEIGVDMDARVTEIFVQNGWTPVRGEYDLSGIMRVLVFCI
ncbi:MAG: peptide chain release factor N(5)-glutamine methyltransferase [Alphaproteobacteria bacterium]|nr:peptide chain release factor N(5)-glutamine methyltransferase [Alphaproteobacteria bacterium]